MALWGTGEVGVSFAWGVKLEGSRDGPGAGEGTRPAQPYPEAGAVGVGPQQAEPIPGLELAADGEGDEGGVVPGDEVLGAGAGGERRSPSRPRRPAPAGPTFCAGRTSQCSVSFSSWNPACSSRLRHSATTARGEEPSEGPRRAGKGQGGRAGPTASHRGRARGSGSRTSPAPAPPPAQPASSPAPPPAGTAVTGQRRHHPTRARNPGDHPGHGPTRTPRPPGTCMAAMPCPAPPPRPARPLLARRNAPRRRGSARSAAPRDPHRAPCTLHPLSCTPHPAPRALHLVPCTPHPAPGPSKPGDCPSQGRAGDWVGESWAQPGASGVEQASQG